MAIYSPLRSRRLAAQQAEALQRIITFQLRQETFALPLDRVQKVTTLDRLYGDANGTGISLTTYQGRELVVIDVGQRIFGNAPTVLPASNRSKRTSITDPLSTLENLEDSEDDVTLVRYLLILQCDDGSLVGLPIDSPPSIQSISLSAFQPLPTIYRQQSNIHCVSSFSIDRPDRPSIFLLDATLVLKD
jgi:chemotaxis signal transduction protein